MTDHTLLLTKEKLLKIADKKHKSIASNETRAKAFDCYNSMEFPSQKDENWRHTTIKLLLNNEYIPSEYKEISREIVKKFSIPRLSANVLVFVNGFFVESFSEIIDKKAKFIAGNLASAKDNHSEQFNAYFDSTNITKNSIFTALNTATAEVGTFLYIPDNEKIESPVVILHLNYGDERPTFTQTRNLFIAGKNSSVSIIEAYRSVNESVNFTNTATEIFLADNANVDYNIFQGAGDNSFLMNHCFVNQAKSSRLTACTTTLCGALVRNEFQVAHNGQWCETTLNGIYLPDKHQHFDNIIHIKHLQPNCTSNQLYRGVVDNQASAVFLGNVYVAKDAQKTNAYQSNKNVLLSLEARVNSKPQLEIYADDVKCTHGSTIGQLDSEALFYLQARGLPEAKAKIMLLSAFFTDVLDKIQNESLRKFISFLIEKRLHGEKTEHQCMKIDYEDFNV